MKGGRPHRQRPEGFDERAPHTPTRQLARDYRCDHATAIRWLAEIGIHRLQTQPAEMPEGFADVAAQWTSAKLQAHFDLSEHVVARFRKMLGIKLRSRVAEPVPEGFAGHAHVMSEKVLAERYGVSPRTVGRWRVQLGISGAAHRFNRPIRAGVKARAPVAHSTEEMAANHLRRVFPVYRCRVDGRADPRGGFWRCGTAVLTSDEMLSRAARKGFDPDAWRRLG